MRGKKAKLLRKALSDSNSEIEIPLKGNLAKNTLENPKKRTQRRLKKLYKNLPKTLKPIK